MALDTSFVGFASHKTSQHPWNFMVCGVVVNAVAGEEGDKSVTEAEDMILSSLSLYALSAAFQLVCPKMVAGMVCMPGSQRGYPKAVAGPICNPPYV